MIDSDLKLVNYLLSRGQSPTQPRNERLDAKLLVFCHLAKDLSKLSTCRRLKVGCAIVPLDLSGVLAIGYNGVPSGEDNFACDGREGNCPCIHAEANALVKLQSARDCLLLTSVSPCLHCAGLIVNSGVIRVVGYFDAYRDLSGLDRLRAAGIATVQL